LIESKKLGVKMLDWNEMKYAALQEKLEHANCFGMENIGLDEGAFTVMCAYLIGLSEGANDEFDEDDLEGLSYIY
jgi:hypothetical protein